MQIQLEGLKIYDRDGKVTENVGLPLGTKVRVEALPDNNFVFRGKIEDSDGMTINVSPGKYIIVLDFSDDPTGKRHLRNQYEVLVGITEAQWQALSLRRPQMHRFSATTKGDRWICKQFGCKHATASRIDALLHEAKHIPGTPDLLKMETITERTLIDLTKKTAAAAEASKKLGKSEVADDRAQGPR